jgi:hypothetical protein
VEIDAAGAQVVLFALEHSWHAVEGVGPLVEIDAAGAQVVLLVLELSWHAVVGVDPLEVSARRDES